jgi:hypothetical protein
MMITLRIDYQAHLGPLSEIPGQVATSGDKGPAQLPEPGPPGGAEAWLFNLECPPAD